MDSLHMPYPAEDINYRENVAQRLFGRTGSSFGFQTIEEQQCFMFWITPNNELQFPIILWDDTVSFSQIYNSYEYIKIDIAIPRYTQYVDDEIIEFMNFTKFEWHVRHRSYIHRVIIFDFTHNETDRSRAIHERFFSGYACYILGEHIINNTPAFSFILHTGGNCYYHIAVFDNLQYFNQTIKKDTLIHIINAQASVQHQLEESQFEMISSIPYLHHYQWEVLYKTQIILCGTVIRNASGELKKIKYIIEEEN